MCVCVYIMNACECACAWDAVNVFKTFQNCSNHHTSQPREREREREREQKTIQRIKESINH